LRVLGIIPARGGSKGLPGKNIKLLNGIPLIAYTIKEAIKSKLEECIVTTDSEEIASISRLYGGNIPFIRPIEIATDNASSIDVVLHALNFMKEHKNKEYDAIMLLQPTTPFRDSEDINQALDLLIKSDADSVISVTSVGGTHPARMKFIKDGNLIDPPFVEEFEGQNRQELKPMFIRNGGIYLTRINTIKNGSFKGDISKAYVMPEKKSVNIDNIDDFEFAEWLMTKNK
jgi:CMP-N,N'-diacetyllegionaminic acid synthase